MPSAYRNWVAKAKKIVESAQARAEHERERRYVVALAFSIADRGRRTASSVLAGALAFRFFLTAAPTHPRGGGPDSATSSP